MVSEAQIEAAAIASYEYEGDRKGIIYTGWDFEPEEVKRQWRSSVRVALTAAEQAEPAAAEPVELCPDCVGSGYINNPDSGQVCYRCNGQGGYAHPAAIRKLKGGE